MDFAAAGHVARGFNRRGHGRHNIGAHENVSAWNTAHLVDIGGRRLACRDAGEGQPPIVFEMGLGAEGREYDAIAERIAESTRVIWYDHTGMGQSDPALTPRTVADLAADLHALLAALPVPPPYVLVGHSLGGLTVRYYRQRHPDEVAALVLIDAAHEDQRERLLAALPPESPGELPAIARYRHALTATWADPTANPEGIDNLANSRLMSACAPLGDLPLVVVSRGHAQSPSGFPPDLIERREQAWRTMQRELADLSTCNRHLIAACSGHLVNEDQPEIIVEAVVQALTLARG